MRGKKLKMSKYNKWMQYFWLSVAIISGAYAVVSYVGKDDQPVEILIYVMPFLAFTLFLIRLWHNRKMERLKEENKTNESKVDN